jgi:hypothetical protein
MLYPLSYGGPRGDMRAATDDERLSGGPGNGRHTRLVTKT